VNILHVVPGLNADQGGIRTAVVGTVQAMLEGGMRAECVCVGQPEPPIPGLPITSFEPSSPRLTRASTGLKKWLAVHAADYDAIIVHTLWLSPTRYAVDAARVAGVPVYLVSHGMLDPDALAHHAWRKRLRWLGGEGRRVRACTLVFSTELDAQRARSTAEARDLPCVVIPNAVDRRWQAAARAPNDVPLILCLNRLHPRKGVLELVHALVLLHKRGARFHCEFAGHAQDSEYATRVRRTAAPLEKAGLLRWLGSLDVAAAVARVQAADILVHPATGYENFGMVIAEAASAGLCVLASPRALLAPEMAQAGALEVCEPEPSAIAKALAALLADSQRRAELGRKAQQYAQRFTATRAAKSWHEILAKGQRKSAKL